ncbi:MAG: transposase [Patescibacteria group bacterium]|nr:transposase [Patescibacteria group bacterium]
MFKNLPKFNDRSYVHFITTKTFENKSIFKNNKCCEILLDEINFYRQKLGFKILGYVIMPDHFHCLIWWDVDEKPQLTISNIIKSIKSHSAKEIINYLQTGRRKPSLSPYSKGEGNDASEGSHPPERIEILCNDESNILYPSGRIEILYKYASEDSYPPLENESLYLLKDYKWENIGQVHTTPKHQIWQKGFYDFNIFTQKKFEEKLNYIHKNPLSLKINNLDNYVWSSYRQIMGLDHDPILKINYL